MGGRVRRPCSRKRPVRPLCPPPLCRCSSCCTAPPSPAPLSAAGGRTLVGHNAVVAVRVVGVQGNVRIHLRAGRGWGAGTSKHRCCMHGASADCECSTCGCSSSGSSSSCSSSSSSSGGGGGGIRSSGSTQASAGGSAAGVAPVAAAAPTHLQVWELVLEERDGALGQAVGVEGLLGCGGLELLRGLGEDDHLRAAGQWGGAGMSGATRSQHSSCRRLGSDSSSTPQAAAARAGRARSASTGTGAHTWLTPTERASATASTSPFFQPRRDTPGMESMGMFLSPS